MLADQSSGYQVQALISTPFGMLTIIHQRPIPEGKIMASYRIVGARPKNASNHVNSQFDLWELNNNKWKNIGWKSIDEVSGLMRSGHEVLTGKIVNNTMWSGAAVEVELRIAKNDTNYKISDMPDT